eukprot:scaffold1202_cov384-Prasinococcus_capsulatus_cf.AAC.20
MPLQQAHQGSPLLHGRLHVEGQPRVHLDRDASGHQRQDFRREAAQYVVDHQLDVTRRRRRAEFRRGGGDALRDDVLVMLLSAGLEEQARVGGGVTATAAGNKLATHRQVRGRRTGAATTARRTVRICQTAAAAPGPRSPPPPWSTRRGVRARSSRTPRARPPGSSSRAASLAASCAGEVVGAAALMYVRASRHHPSDTRAGVPRSRRLPGDAARRLQCRAPARHCMREMRPAS